MEFKSLTRTIYFKSSKANFNVYLYVSLQALSKLDEIEVHLTSTDLPRNSAALAERHAYLSNSIVESTTPALREGRILLERVSRDDPGVQGVGNKVRSHWTKISQSTSKSSFTPKL